MTSPVPEDFYQVASEVNEIIKARKLKAVNQDCDWLEVVEIVGNIDGRKTQIVFHSDCALWNVGASELSRTRLHVNNLDSLRHEGVYCYKMKVWKRNYLTKDGICIHLIEDIPDCGGQFCLWSAGIVMAKYLEYYEPLRCSLTGRRVLELGAGSGLPSMVAAVLGADVFCSEQESCLSYLRRNVQLNPDISVRIRGLGWTDKLRNATCKFDIIIGCDITYDPKNFISLINVVKEFLSDDGMALLCHDNDSCPLSKFASESLQNVCRDVGFTFTELDYTQHMAQPFSNRLVKMWKLTK